MIHVDRSSVQRPKILDSRAALQEKEQAQSFIADGGRSQKRFLFKVYRHSEMREALGRLFANKCAYCESPLGVVGHPQVEMYRPKGAVKENPNHPGYWWLTTNWENFLLACDRCANFSGKSNRFPLIDEESRGFAPGEELCERPLLLNPCDDDPDKHLIFDWAGTVASRTDRGQATIAILSLNRMELVSARANTARELKNLTEYLSELLKAGLGSQAIKSSTEQVLRNIRRLADGDSAYAGMVRQLLANELDRIFDGRLTVEMRKWFFQGEKFSEAYKARVKKEFKDFEEQQSIYVLSSEEGQFKSKFQRRHIQSIYIRNFKGVRELFIDLDAEGANAGWLMLLGENSTGKSSVLQAITLCLAGANYTATLLKEKKLQLSELIYFRAKKSVVEIKLSGFQQPHKMTVTDKKVTFHRHNDETDVLADDGGAVVGDQAGKEPSTVLLAYGATRLLPRSSDINYGQRFARIDNLFDPFLPLFDANTWLKEVKKPLFDAVALTMKDLLALEDEAVLGRERGEVVVKVHGEKVPIKRLSEGFQSVVAMSVDMLEVATRLWGRAEHAEGIVLIDELGTHLHPTWKMKIVASLRRAFPGMQFIATTHEPLCLRGLDKGEVVVMRRDESNHIYPVTGLPSPSDFRIDQLLTSEFFGLSSTVDPEVELLFDEYYALLALTQRTKEQDVRLKALKSELQARRYVGDTAREQLMFEAVDRVIARSREEGRVRIPELKGEVTSEISKIWEEAIADIRGQK
ncbi:AAA family ATPase [Pseudomonas sp. G11]|uniref:AAA family ATPase n=1 Tax=Pseudomonas sp. G11 TaxID=528343 RepID=UPI00240297F6|nr:AAA family ATPase [Pseudomonas sp. G11]WEX14262.1 AAA family ATPase [Pseudomonas sp. G11]